MSETDDRLKELSEKLEAGVKDIFSGEKYRAYLNTMSKFHRYSYRNSMLIFLQNPHATYVAGFGAWKSMERSVNKGEKGLQILAPAPYKKIVTITKDENGNPLPEPQQKEVTVTAFRPTYVFDVSQTQGKELPRLVTQLTGQVAEYDKLLRSLYEISPCSIQFEAMKGKNGYYSPDKNYIGIKMGMSEEQTVKTTIHEIAHAKFEHGMETDRQLAEVQAESVAYIVCQHFGIDSSQYSFGYVAGWSLDKDASVLKDCLASIQKVAKDVIDGVELELTRELTVEKELAAMTPEETKSLVREVKFAEAFGEDVTEHDKLLYEAAIKSQHVIKQPEKVVSDVPEMTQDGFSLFYAGAGGQDKQAHDFQKETGWNMAWGSDSNGLNGDTWIVYRSIEDLPKQFQKIVPNLQHQVRNVITEPLLQEDGKKLRADKPKKLGVADKLEAAKKQVAERASAAPPQEHTQSRSSGHSR